MYIVLRYMPDTGLRPGAGTMTPGAAPALPVKELRWPAATPFVYTPEWLICGYRTFSMSYCHPCMVSPA